MALRKTFKSRVLCSLAAPAIAVVVLSSSAVYAQTDAIPLDQLDLEGLMNVRVTSVSRHEEQLRHVPGAVYVITREDIRQSGMSDLAELLRLVPGLDVARINSSSWAVTARGFNAQYAGKLLVVVDGRIVYDPGFSGVFWSLQNLVLEDIDRIEVIRGPGATMWGANAVNGVISVVTRTPEQTQGGLFVTSAGTDRLGEGSARYGGTIGKNAFYRFSGRQTTRSGFPTASDQGSDSWNMTTGNLRADWDATRKDSFSFTVEGYRGSTGSRLMSLSSLNPIEYSPERKAGYQGGSLTTRWSHTFASSEFKVQAYFDRREHTGAFAKKLSIVDLDIQHHITAFDRHDLMWGIGYRETRDSFSSTLAWSFKPARENSGLASGFVQDEITLFEDKLYLTLGTKFEKKAFAKIEIQPSVRAVWMPGRRYSVWFSASSAARTPNRAERGRDAKVFAFPMGPMTGVVSFVGNEKAGSEHLTAYEAGGRYSAGRKLWLDVASFYNSYRHLSTLEAGTPFMSSESDSMLFVFPYYSANKMHGETYGAEAAANYRVNEFLQLKGSYSFFRANLHQDRDSTDFFAEAAEHTSPRSQIQLTSLLTLPKSFELSGHGFFVGPRRAYQIPGYTRVDLNVTWKGFEGLELSLIGQNLLGSHAEFVGDFPMPEVRRSIGGRLTWKL